jgi:polysaccharide biosynthesis/export protein
MTWQNDGFVCGRLARALLSVLALSGMAWAQDAYEIGPGDVLTVVVLGQQEMSGEMAVDQEGLLTFPVLGKVKASAMTTKELERKLATLLADGYLKRPELSVSVKEYRSQRIIVTGEVQKPGLYALKADPSLLALLSEIGAMTTNAGHQVVVIRPPSATSGADPVAFDGQGVPETVPGAEIFRINLDDLRSGKPEANLTLRAGDTVHLPLAAQVYVSGNVARPGSYRFQSGMTVLQAITLAGGATERGSAKRVKIMRTIDGGKKQIKPRLTDAVEPEDTLIVPERFF